MGRSNHFVFDDRDERMTHVTGLTTLVACRETRDARETCCMATRAPRTHTAEQA